MLNKQFNNVYQNSSHSLQVKHAKNVKIKKEKQSMVKTYCHLFKYLDFKDMDKYLNFILINTDKVLKQQVEMLT